MSEYRSNYANSHALIVGINTYSDPRFVPLGQAEADAQAMADLLGAPPYSFGVTLLLGAQATKSTILRSLHQLRRAKPDDRLLIYFAGHGYTLADKNGSETGYLACADTVPDEDFTALELQDVIDLTRHTEAKHIGFIFDACFSGQALGLTRAPATSADKYLQRRAYQVISAGAGDETVSDYRSMTGSLIDALKSDVLLDDGVVTMSELGLHLRDVIASDSRQTQIPQFGHIRGSQGGDFVFYVDTRVRLPADLEDALRSPRANTRWGAVADLIELAHTETGDLATLARERLAHIAHEDADQRVRNAAQSYFDEIAAGGDGTLTQSEIRSIRQAREITPSQVGKPPDQPPAPDPNSMATLPSKIAPLGKPAAPPPPAADPASKPAAWTMPAPMPILAIIGVMIIAFAVLSQVGLPNAGRDQTPSPTTQIIDNDNAVAVTPPPDTTDTPTPTIAENMLSGDLSRLFLSPEEAGAVDWNVGAVQPLSNENLAQTMPDSDIFLEQVSGDAGRIEGWSVEMVDVHCDEAYVVMQFRLGLYSDTQGAITGHALITERLYQGSTVISQAEAYSSAWFETPVGACERSTRTVIVSFAVYNVDGMILTTAFSDLISLDDQGRFTNSLADQQIQKIGAEVECQQSGRC